VYIELITIMLWVSSVYFLLAAWLFFLYQ